MFSCYLIFFTLPMWDPQQRWYGCWGQRGALEYINWYSCTYLRKFYMLHQRNCAYPITSYWCCLYLQCIWLKDCSCMQLLMYVTCPCRDCRAWRMIAFNWVPSREKLGTCSNDLKSDRCTGKGSKLIATWNPGNMHGMKEEYWSTLTEILLDNSATVPTSPLPTNLHDWAWELACTSLAS